MLKAQKRDVSHVFAMPCGRVQRDTAVPAIVLNTLVGKIRSYVTLCK